jgi:(E)-4-hydroxy-3-methylbut-2-enyl-diphosphate synthase
MGIGTLLEDGLGDTIRVSLTEEPEFEIPVAKALADRYTKRTKLHNDSLALNNAWPQVSSPFAYKRRASRELANIGAHQVPRIIADLSNIGHVSELSLRAIDFFYDAASDKWNMGEQGADYIYLGDKQPGFMLPNGTKGIFNYSSWLHIEDRKNNYPLIPIKAYASISERSPYINFLSATAEELDDETITTLQTDATAVLVLSTKADHAMPTLRQGFFKLIEAGNNIPVIIHCAYENLNKEDFLLHCATDTGGLLADGLGDGLFIQYLPEDGTNAMEAVKLVNHTAFYILQAGRTRISKTEYIS